ncbi:MAG: helix-turn-helix domain-containing protein [Nitriliruptoraceae bacterium]|nr:helix-turn-helix domain-containing protein [Nitriliruptoraceae bacterium]
MDRLLSPSDVAEVLEVPIATLYRWRQNRYGPPAIKVGKHLRYRERDVQSFIDDQFAAADRAGDAVA